MLGAAVLRLGRRGRDLVAAKEEAATQLGKANVLESQITFLTHQNTHLLGCVTGTPPRMPPAPK